jgi:hypothetical protein
MSPRTATPVTQRNTSLDSADVPRTKPRSSNSNQGLTIIDSMTGGRVTSYEQISLHHHRPNEPYFIRKINGPDGRKIPIIGRKDTELVVIDIVCKDANGSTKVPVRTPVSGYVQKGYQVYRKPNGKIGGAGHYVDIYDKPAGTPGRKRIGRMFHLDEESSLANGSYIDAGTIVGIQGNTGGSTGPHKHIETVPEVLEEYIRAIQTGDFSKLRNLEINRDKRSGHPHADPTANVSSGAVESLSGSALTNTSDQNVQADLKKIVVSILKNAEAIKIASGIDVTNPKGLGQAVMNYWRANNLKPEILQAQLASISDVDITDALNATSQTSETSSAQIQSNVSNSGYAV